MDATVLELMKAGHVAGTALAVVHDGRVVLLRGYGLATVDPPTQVEPERTLFRIGSVSKTLTAIAALQLVETGVLDMNRDVRAYLPGLPLPYGATMHQLLTHTAGLDERFAGAYTDDPRSLEPLWNHLLRNPPEQVRPPGTFYSYSNYHYAIAGGVIEKLSGVGYEQYMAERVFDPFGLLASTAHQPPAPALMGRRAQGYEWRDGRHVALPMRFTYASPSGGISTSAGDMARVLLALLADGSFEGKRLLSPAGVTALLREQYTPDPRIPATAYGLTHWRTHDQRLLHKDGTLGDQIGVLVLAPNSKLGIFAASNSLPGVANALLEPLLTHLFGPEQPPPAPLPITDSSGRIDRVLGTYQDAHHTRNDMSRPFALMLQSRVTSESAATIQWRGRRWVEVAPFVFTSADGRDTIVFRENAAGEIDTLHAWGGTHERIQWFERAAMHLGVLAVCSLVFLGGAVSMVRGTSRKENGWIARAVASVIATANMAFVVWLLMSLRGLGASVPLPLSQVVWLSVPVATALGATFLLLFALQAWRRRWWSVRSRVLYSVLALCAVAFPLFLNYWRVLGVRY